MRRSYRLAVALAAVAAAAAAALTAQGGSTAKRWTRVSGPTQPGVELGLARTANGVLHVIWNRGVSPASIFETRFSPAGRAVGTSTVASGYDGNGGLALLVMPDGTLRLFAAGATSRSSPADGINLFTAPASGGRWSLQSGVTWGGAVANASGLIGAALTKDGQPVTAWRGYAAEGAPPSSVPQDAYVGDQTASHLSTDAVTGAVVLSGVTIAGKGGLFVRQILPTPSAPVTLPLPFGLNDWFVGSSGRIGAPGVYVAYTDTRAVRLYRYGHGSKTLATGAYRSATVCAGPGGRLWVAWGDSNSALFVTRSNRAASGFEPVQKLKLAPGTIGLTFLQCEGSTGPLDLFADFGVGNSNQQGFWHTHVLAQMALTAHVAKTKAGTKVTISARDAGDPVARAAIAVGGRRLTMNARGEAALSLRPGSYAATATAAGYAPATIRFRI
jgi:hypothetical protein